MKIGKKRLIKSYIADMPVPPAIVEQYNQYEAEQAAAEKQKSKQKELKIDKYSDLVDYCLQVESSDLKEFLSSIKKEHNGIQTIEKLQNDMKKAEEGRKKIISFIGKMAYRCITNKDKITDSDKQNIMNVITKSLDDNHETLIEKIEKIRNKLANIKLGHNDTLKIDKHFVTFVHEFCKNNEAALNFTDKMYKLSLNIKGENSSFDVSIGKEYDKDDFNINAKIILNF